MALDDVVNNVSSSVNGVLGKEGPIQETGRMILGGLAGAAAPIVLGACGTLSPQVAMNPLSWFYSGGLGFTATGVHQLDSLSGKLLMTIPAVGYFLPKTIETLGYGIAANVPYASGVLGTIGAGLNSAVGYVTSAFSYTSAYVGAALPYIGIGIAAIGIGYAGYRIVKGWYNKLKGRRTYNGARNSRSKKSQNQQK